MALVPLSAQSVFDNGQPMLGLRLAVLDANTNTPHPVYATADYGVQRENPVKMLGSGRFPAMYVAGGLYDLRIVDEFGYVYEEITGLSGDSDTGGGGGSTPPDATAVFQTGDVKDRYSTGTHPGWVRMNGRTIGSTASAATERANDDTHALFVFLWSNDANLAVSGGRGSNAESDWSANKTIALPDQRGRGRVGLDGMGATAASRLAGGVFGFGTADALGSYGGTATHQLTGNQLAKFTPSGAFTASAEGNHAHSGDTGNDFQDHFHTFATGTVAVQAGGSTAIRVIGGGDIIGTSGVSARHTHPFVTNNAGIHSHVISATFNSIGNDEAHNNLSPFILVTSYIKL